MQAEGRCVLSNYSILQEVSMGGSAVRSKEREKSEHAGTFRTCVESAAHEAVSLNEDG